MLVSSLRRSVVNWCSALFLLAVQLFPFDAHAADDCAYVKGTRTNTSSPCKADAEVVITAASNRISERIDKGTPPTPKEVTALKTLIGRAQQLLLHDAPEKVAKERIEQQLDELGGVVSIYPREMLESPGATYGKITDLVSKLFVWMAGAEGSFGAYAASLDEYLDSASVKNEAEVAFRYGLPAEFVGLISTSLDKAKANTTGTVIVASNALIKFIDDNKVTENIDANSDVLLTSLFDDKAGLIARLHAIEEKSKRPAPVVLRRANALSSALDEALDESTPAKKRKALIIRQALARTDIFDKLNTIQDQAERLTEPLEPKIHIVRAWYGRIGRKPPPGSRCSAIHAMRTSCERRASCSAEANANSLPDPVKLCGFDPAPVARGLARGLVVEYSCEAGDDSFWAELAKDPLSHPDDEEKIITAVLRSSAMTISCAFPVAQAP